MRHSRYHSGSNSVLQDAAAAVARLQPPHPAWQPSRPALPASDHLLGWGNQAHQTRASQHHRTAPLSSPGKARMLRSTMEAAAVAEAIGPRSAAAEGRAVTVGPRTGGATSRTGDAGGVAAVSEAERLARGGSGDSTTEAVVLEDIQAAAVRVSETTRKRRVRSSPTPLTCVSPKPERRPLYLFSETAAFKFAGSGCLSN